MKQSLRVVIVGRTNVGKSTLFNRLTSNSKSIALDQEGVTRDTLSERVSWDGKEFELIDTGGISFRKTQDAVLSLVYKKALDTLTTADLVLFVCDGTIGVVPEDRDIARQLHKLGKKVLLLVNKVDRIQAQEHLHEFERLGHGAVIEISAQHGRGFADLLEQIVENLPEFTPSEGEDDKSCNVVLLGKPNVGKSSLMNALLQYDRSIVANEPGTTRDTISENIRFYKENIVVTDTPGVRKKRSVHDTLETIMVKGSFKAVRNADIVLLLVDASAGRLSDQEIKLAFYALDNYKALMLVFNKQDLVDEEIQEQWEFNLSPLEHVMKKVSVARISCKTGFGIGKMLTRIDQLWKRYGQEFSNDELSVLLKEALVRKPLFHKRNPLILRTVHQVATAPITILLRVNQPQWFGPSQCAFFENILRKKYNLVGVPVRFIIRKAR